MPCSCIIIKNEVFHAPSQSARAGFVETWPGERTAILSQIDAWADAQVPIEAITSPVQQAAHEFLCLQQGEMA